MSKMDEETPSSTPATPPAADRERPRPLRRGAIARSAKWVGLGIGLLLVFILSLSLIRIPAPQPLEPDLEAAAAAITAAHHVAWFFPCWWNAPPALVKGFIDRVFTPGFAFRYTAESALPQKLLAGR